LNPLEIRSLKPDNEFADSFGFGCTIYSPGRCFSTGRSFSFHSLSIRNPLTYVNTFPLVIRDRVTYTLSMARRKLPPEILEFFKKQGAKGGKIGGTVRAANMTAEQRSESARNAVRVRWAKVKPNPDPNR
jgi:hypothetical protein